MALTKAKKGELIADLTASVTDAVSLAFVRFNALTVAEANELRASLKKEGVKFKVAKKTLLGRALTAAGIEGEAPDMPGEIAIAWLPSAAGADLTAAMRGMSEFVKKFKDKLTLVGGVIEKRFLTALEAQAYAAIPPVQTLRGMFVNVINSPLQRFAIALGEVAKTKV